MSTNSNASEAVSYRSGVAARLAGIPVETLRVWERRYGVIGPRLSLHGQRLYSAADVERLTQIKRLIDMGHPIGVIAGLSSQTLIGMLDTERAFNTQGEREALTARQVRIALVGPLLSARWTTDVQPGSPFRVIARSPSIAHAGKLLQQIEADVAVIEFSTLNDDSPAIIANLKAVCGAEQAIALYRFAPSMVVRRLRAAGHEVARAPADAHEIQSLCQALLRLPPQRKATDANHLDSIEPTPSRFDEQSLAELASASNTVQCECPRHLVDLVLNISSFEQYSAECVHRSPEDAALHRDLQRTAAQVRSMLEGALIRVALAEGLPVPEGAAQNG